MEIDLAEIKRLIAAIEAAPKETWEELSGVSGFVCDLQMEVDQLDHLVESFLREDEDYARWMDGALARTPLVCTGPLRGEDFGRESSHG